MAELFRRYPTHLNDLVDNQLQLFDGYNEYYLSKSVDLPAIQDKFDENGVIVKQRQMISNTSYTEEIRAPYGPIKQMFHGLIDPFQTVHNCNAKFHDSVDFVKIYDMETDNQFVGRYTNVEHDMDFQLTNPKIRGCMEFLQIYNVKDNDVIIPTLYTSKMMVDGAENRSKRATIATGIQNTSRTMLSSW
eukprot:87123_1